MATFNQKLIYKQLMELYNRYGEQIVKKRYSFFKNRYVYWEYKITEVSESCFELFTTNEIFLENPITVYVNHNNRTIEELDDRMYHLLNTFISEMNTVKAITPRQKVEIERLQTLQREQGRMNQYELFIPIDELTYDQADCVIYILKVRTDELGNKVDNKVFDICYSVCEEIATLVG